MSGVLDADIRSFFDVMDRAWMRRFIAHRSADRRRRRLIEKWLSAAVMEDGKGTYTETGTPQGATISPLLANIFRHYVFDLWANQWRRRKAQGDVIIVRYADDSVVGFQHRGEAERCRAELRERMVNCFFADGQGIVAFLRNVLSSGGISEESMSRSRIRSIRAKSLLIDFLLTSVSLSHGDDPRSVVAGRVGDDDQPSRQSKPNVISRSSP